MRRRKFVRMDGAALVAAGASPVLALGMTAIGGAVAMPAEEPEADERAGKVAVVRVEGAIAHRAVAGLCAYVDGYDAIAARLELALESDADGVLLVVDSPGGDVAGLEAGVERMRAAVEASGKRVVAYVDELAASAAYLIAAAVADEIVMPEAAVVGSIGCIGAIVDLTEQQKMDGATWTVVRAPAGKAENMPYAPIADLARERLTAAVEASSGRFVAAVAEARKVSAKDVRKLDGALLRGSEAVQRGLADHVGSMDFAAARAVATGPSPRRKRDMDHAAMAAALGLEASASVDEIVTAAKAAVAKIASLEVQVEALRAKVAEADALRAKIDALEAAKREDEIRAIVDGAVSAKKLAPAKREGLLAQAQQHGAEWTKALVDALPVLVGGEPPRAPAPKGPSGEALDEHGLTARQRAIAAEHKIDPRQYAADLARLAPQGR